jgi:hypothetical protein
MRDVQCQAQNRFGFHSPSVLAAFQRTARNARLRQMAIMSGTGRNLISLVNHSSFTRQLVSKHSHCGERLWSALGIYSRLLERALFLIGINICPKHILGIITREFPLLVEILAAWQLPGCHRCGLLPKRRCPAASNLESEANVPIILEETVDVPCPADKH